ncbi:MAG: HNH endonuclease signature motif containing protein [Ilumatobacteraceae bacterium]
MDDLTGALAAITDQLIAAGPHGLDHVSLHELIVTLQAERDRLGVAVADLLVQWDTRRMWRTDGSRSATHRLSRDTHTSVRTGHAELARAHAIARVPGVRDAVVARTMSLDHVELFARAHQPHRSAHYERDEADLIAKCTQLRYRDAYNLIQYWCSAVDDEVGHGPALPKPSRLHVSTTIDGTVVLDGLLDAIDGSVVADELRRLERELYLEDQRTGVTRLRSERMAAALVVMARRSASTPEDARRPAPLFTVLIGEHTFDHLCELANGTILRAEELLPHLDAALVESILFDGPSTVIAVSSRRAFVGAARRAIQVRDRRCQHRSGCDVPANQCDVDHIVPFSHGGVTSQFNARMECRPHNRHADLHDHGQVPLSERTVDRLDELRARLRWRCRHLTDADDEPAAATVG